MNNTDNDKQKRPNKDQTLSKQFHSHIGKSLSDSVQENLRIIPANKILATAVQRWLTVSSKSLKPATYSTMVAKEKQRERGCYLKPILPCQHIAARYKVRTI